MRLSANKHFAHYGHHVGFCDMFLFENVKVKVQKCEVGSVHHVGFFNMFLFENYNRSGDYY